MNKQFLAAIRPHIREMHVYLPPLEKSRVKLGMNENPFATPPAILAETERRWQKTTWTRYPDALQTDLREKLAAFNNWDFGGIVVGNGSNEMIQAAMLATLGDNRRVLLSEPTFSIYRQVAQLLNAEILSVALDENLDHDTAAICRKIEDFQPSLIILCAPNNPTGKPLSERNLRQVLQAAQGLVVVDEAYYEFAGTTFLPLIKEFPNLIIFRTFSKSLGMPAFRIGYLLAVPELANELRKAILPYNVNAFSQIAATVAVEKYQTEIVPLVEKIIVERNDLFDKLAKIKGLTPIPTETNFILVHSEIAPKKVVAGLIERDILIRDMSGNPRLKDYFRISVGTPAENTELLTNLREILNVAN